MHERFNMTMIGLLSILSIITLSLAAFIVDFPQPDSTISEAIKLAILHIILVTTSMLSMVGAILVAVIVTNK